MDKLSLHTLGADRPYVSCHNAAFLPEVSLLLLSKRVPWAGAGLEAGETPSPQCLLAVLPSLPGRRWGPQRRLLPADLPHTLGARVELALGAPMYRCTSTDRLPCLLLMTTWWSSTCYTCFTRGEAGDRSQESYDQASASHGLLPPSNTLSIQ